jgi:LysM repeat protein
MPIFLNIRFAAPAFCLILLLGVSSAHADMDPRYKLDSQTLAGVKSVAVSHKSSKKRPSSTPAEAPAAAPGNCVIYTVKPGDHIYKILRRDYGLTTKEAWQFMKEIKHANNISDFEVIKAGHKLVIPPVRRSSDGSLIEPHTAHATQVNSGPDSSVRQEFRLESSVPPIAEQEAVAGISAMWNQLIPPTKQAQQTLAINTPAFSFTIGPERYPMFDRMDGGRIVLDQNSTVPELVKSLVEDKDPSVRIVSEEPARSKHFMASLLGAAGFYSVDENFCLDFGSDPKLTMQFDFKVEKTAESITGQGVDLVNIGHTSLTPTLTEFLKNQGFLLYEPFASRKPSAQRNPRAIYSVSSQTQTDVIDSILNAFSVSPERNRRVDVFSTVKNGFSLSVNTNLYFERGGQRYIVTNFDGDPINYTLFRILGTKGYNVVILEASDDFRKISNKLITRMKMQSTYAQHDLIHDGATGYTLQMSGYKLDDALLPGGGIFLTDRTMNPVVRDLFKENGFNINSR